MRAFIREIALIKASAALCIMVLSGTAQANFPLEGSFTAQKVCPAFHSIRRQTNPGNLFTQAGKTYPLQAKNKAAATHYLILINKKQRWVQISCGQPSDDQTEVDTTPRKNQDYLLAVSWQPTFCQTHQAKSECRSQTPTRYDAHNLSLHGLWPQPRNNAYCGVNTTLKSIDRRGEWHLLPALKLSKPLRKALDKLMPGTASHLQRHEWYKHGTCYSPDPETYYRDSLLLMQQLNDSAVRTLFSQNIGSYLESQQIRAAFDKSFGKGTGSKVNIRCNRNMIAEIWVNLRGEINTETTLNGLLQDAPDVQKLSCNGGKVDPAGF